MSRYIRCSSFKNGNSSTETNEKKNDFWIRFVFYLKVNNRIIGVQRFYIVNPVGNKSFGWQYFWELIVPMSFSILLSIEFVL